MEISQALAEGKENSGNAGRWFYVGRIRLGREFCAATRPGIVKPDASAATRFPAIRQVPAGRIVSGSIAGIRETRLEKAIPQGTSSHCNSVCSQGGGRACIRAGKGSNSFLQMNGGSG